MKSYGEVTVTTNSMNTKPVSAGSGEKKQVVVGLTRRDPVIGPFARGGLDMMITVQ